MAYRDATAARRAQLDELIGLAEELRDRMTEALVERLETADRLAMDEAIAAARRSTAGGTKDLDAAMAAHGALVATLERIIAGAPKLARRFNRHPRRFPPEARPSHGYAFPDIYHSASMSFRDGVHRTITQLDPEARLFDRRQNYQLRMDRPYLVDACFHYRKAPLRLALSVHGSEMDRHLTSYWALWVLLRPSAPNISVYPQKLDDRILKLFRLRRDVEVGAVEFDRHFIVEASDGAAARSLHPDVQEGLMGLREYGVSLVVREQCARLQWQVDMDTRALSLRTGLDTMAALRRRLKPALLLRPQ